MKVGEKEKEIKDEIGQIRARFTDKNFRHEVHKLRQKVRRKTQGRDDSLETKNVNKQVKHEIQKIET